MTNSLLVKIISNIIHESKIFINPETDSSIFIPNDENLSKSRQKIRGHFVLLYFYFLDPRNHETNLAFRDHKRNVVKYVAKQINKLRKTLVLKMLQKNSRLKTKNFLKSRFTFYGLPRDITRRIMSFIPNERNNIITSEKNPFVREIIRMNSHHMKNAWRLYVKEIFDCIPESQGLELVEFIFTYKRETMKDVFIKSLLKD